jgi:CDP-diacylglycerol--glycerol-3-phosphate 3-phosphatidyltransferase
MSMMKRLPNILTLSRIAVIPALIATFYMDAPSGNWIAFALFTAAGITDFFDGMIARAYGTTSKLGQFLDPVADKLMIAATIVMLAAFDRVTGLHILALIVILCREILVSGLREFLADLRISMPVTALAKWKTTFQMVALGTLLIGEAAPPWLPAEIVGLACLWLAAALTIYTGYDYMRAGLKHMS